MNLTNNYSDEHSNSGAVMGTTVRAQPCVATEITQFQGFSNEDDAFLKKTQRLTVGQEFRNYKELCELLEEIPTSGTSKTIQLKKWQRYFDWDKKGHRFTITDVFSEPIPKAIREGTVYARLIETLLVAFLSQQKDFKYAATESQIFEILCMTNPEYTKIGSEGMYRALTNSHVEVNGHVYETASPVGRKVETVNYIDFNTRSHKRLKEILYSALNSMSARKLLYYSREVVIVKKVMAGPEDVGHEEGEIISKEFVANVKEINCVLSVEREVLTAMGANNIFQIFSRNKSKQYYEKVNNRLLDRYGWERAYRRLQLIYNQNHLEDAIEETKESLLKAADRQDVVINQKKLNEAILSMLGTDAKSRQSKYFKAKEKELESMGEWDSYSPNVRNREYMENANYLDEQNFLAEYFVKTIRIGGKTNYV